MSDARDLYKLFRELENQHQVNDTVGLHDSFDLELNEHFVIESGVVGFMEDGVIIQLDEEALEFLDFSGMLTESLHEVGLKDHEPRKVEGVYGPKSKPFTKKFNNLKAMNKFFDHPENEGNYEIERISKVSESVELNEISDEMKARYLTKAWPKRGETVPDKRQPFMQRARGAADRHWGQQKKDNDAADIQKVLDRTPEVHDLRHMSHGDVYDLTQTSDDIRDGDVLHVKGGSAIMYKAWPTMVNGDSKSLHSFDTGYSWDDEDVSHYKRAVDIAKSLKEEMGATSSRRSTNESLLAEGSSRAVENAIFHRIVHSHKDVLGKYGPIRTMQAIEDTSYNLNDLEEIGSSDVSIWTRQVIDDLEKGYYDDIDPEVPVRRDVPESAEGSDIFAKVVKSDDPFEVIYKGISGHFGEASRIKLQKIYDGVALDNGLDPGDDFEAIINGMIPRIHELYDIGFDNSAPRKDELDEIKKLAFGRDTLEENPMLMALGTAAASGAGQELAGRVADKIGLEENFISVQDFRNSIPDSSDPFELVYNAIAGDYGDEISDVFQKMYDDVVTDSGYRLHPDDDFEKIIEIVVDQIKKDNHDNVDEGWGKNLLGFGAVVGALAAIAGIDKMEADHLMKTQPQLVTLTQMRQEAKRQGDEKAVDALDHRIRVTLHRIRDTGRPIMGPDGEPVDPRRPLGEAEYQGRKVTLNKPMQGDVAKSKVYVKKPNGKVVKVNFGDKNMTIKKSNPARRKSFRARHNCENPGPKWKARYWSCRAW